MKLKISPKHVVDRWRSRTRPSLDVQEPAPSNPRDTNEGRENEEAPLPSSPDVLSNTGPGNRASQISSSSSNPSAFGLQVLVDGINPVVDIIAVHGLNGHREKTWTSNDGTLWLRDLLPSFVDNARIITYGYDARTHGSGHMTVQFLYDHAITFITRLCTLRRNTKTEERPIIFLAHSLGGILVKSALIHSSFSTPSHLPEHMSIKLSTYGIFFFGTPHSGSGGAAWATALLKIGSIFANTNTSVVKHLKANSEWLRQQVDQFTCISESFHIIHCFEGYPTPLAFGRSSLIVPRASAILPGAINQEVLCFTKDHRELVRFANAQDEDFQSVVSHLKMMVDACQAGTDRNWEVKIKERVDIAEPVKNVHPSKSELFKLPFRLPIPRNPDFVGRKALLTQIHNHIFPPLSGHDQITATDGRVAVLYGLGGMGKTQLALRYAAENRDRFSAIHYVDGSSEINARIGFRDIGQRYADIAMDLVDPEERQRALQRLQLAPYFSQKGQLSYDNMHLIEITKAVTGILEQDGNDSWLLILDNVDELDKFPIQDFLPNTPFRRVIITTRLTAAIRLGYAIEVDSIDEVDGVAILLNSARLRSQETSDDMNAKAIVRKLGCLPLAIEQAGAYISDVQIQLGEYLPLYDKHRRELLERPTIGDVYNSRRQTVFTTWEVSFSTLKKQDEAAAKMLLLFAFLHHENVWEGLFDLALNDETGELNLHSRADFFWLTKLYADKLALRSAFGRIMSFSLAKRGTMPPPGKIILHPLVHAWGRDRSTPSERQKSSILAVFIIAQASSELSRTPSMAQYKELRQKLLLNADACMGFIASDGASNAYERISREPEGISALHAISTLLVDFGRLSQAESVLRSVLATSTDASELGLRAQCQKLLARVVSERGKYDEARSLYETATTTLTKLYGERDLRVLDAATGFGLTNWEIGNLNEAQTMLQSVLSIIKDSSNTLGEIGRKAATTLTLVYWHLGLMSEAEECQRRVLADIDSDTNLDIFSALEPRYTMGIIVQESGQWQAAATIFSDVLTERVKLFGYENRDVARTANALGRVLCFLGKYDRSRELLELAWKQQQDLKLDPMNLAVLRTLFNLAVLKREEGFYDEALDALERAAALQLKRGEETNSYAVVQIELAILKNACGQPEIAVAILEQVQKIQKAKVSPEHPDCIRASLALAQSYLQIGKLNLAEKALRSIQEISPKFLTADHPYNLKLHVTKAEIGRLRGEHGNSVVDDLLDTISRLEKVLGNKHPEMIYASFLLGQVYLEQGLEQQGRECIQWSINALKDCLGENHPKVRELLKLEVASLEGYRPIQTDKRKDNGKDERASV